MKRKDEENEMRRSASNYTIPVFPLLIGAYGVGDAAVVRWNTGYLCCTTRDNWPALLVVLLTSPPLVFLFLLLERLAWLLLVRVFL